MISTWVQRSDGNFEIVHKAKPYKSKPEYTITLKNMAKVESIHQINANIQELTSRREKLIGEMEVYCDTKSV